MGWKATANKNSGEGFEQAPPGNHPAVCVAIIDLGTQENNFQGNVKWDHRAFFVWELVSVKNSSGRNFLVALDLTVSLNVKAKLRSWIEARTSKVIPDGADYDISQELGQPCLLNVVMKGNYAKVESMGAVPTGLTISKPQNTPVIMSLEDFQRGMKVPDWIPWSYGEKISDIIVRCQEITGQGKQPSPPSQSEQPAPVSNRPAPPSSRPTPPSANGSQKPDRKFWIDRGNGQVEEFMESNSIDYLTTNAVDVDKVLVCVDGTEDWKPAKSFGLKTAF